MPHQTTQTWLHKLDEQRMLQLAYFGRTEPLNQNISEHRRRLDGPDLLENPSNHAK